MLPSRPLPRPRPPAPSAASSAPATSAPVVAEDPVAAWAAWLDAVESGARAAAAQAADSGEPQVTVLPMPDLPWPATLEARRREVLVTLAAATTAIERRADETAFELHRLAHPQARPAATGYADGGTLDILG